MPISGSIRTLCQKLSALLETCFAVDCCTLIASSDRSHGVLSLSKSCPSSKSTDVDLNVLSFPSEEVSCIKALIIEPNLNHMPW